MLHLPRGCSNLTVIAAVLRVELHIPDSHSLKEKRSVVRPVTEGLKKVASVSVAEVDFQESWQRCSLGIALVARDVGCLDTLIEAVRRYLDDQRKAEVVNVRVTYLEDPS